MVDGLCVLTRHGTKSTPKDNEWCLRRPLARSIGNSRYQFLSEEKEVLVNRLNEIQLHTCMDRHMEMIWAEWSKSFVSSIRTTVLVDIPGIVDGPNSSYSCTGPVTENTLGWRMSFLLPEARPFRTTSNTRRTRPAIFLMLYEFFTTKNSTASGDWFVYRGHRWLFSF